MFEGCTFFAVRDLSVETLEGLLHLRDALGEMPALLDQNGSACITRLVPLPEEGNVFDERASICKIRAAHALNKRPS